MPQVLWASSETFSLGRPYSPKKLGIWVTLPEFPRSFPTAAEHVLAQTSILRGKISGKGKALPNELVGSNGEFMASGNSL